jgi:hypothetical protein
MGSSESRKETETNQNNVYLPNLLAKQIIGEPEENFEEKKDKIISDTSLEEKNNNNKEIIVIKDNTNKEKEEKIILFIFKYF